MILYRQKIEDWGCLEWKTGQATFRRFMLSIAYRRVDHQ